MNKNVATRNSELNGEKNKEGEKAEGERSKTPERRKNYKDDLVVAFGDGEDFAPSKKIPEVGTLNMV